MKDLLNRSDYNRSTDDEKATQMHLLAERYGMDFKGLHHFERWGQGCVTGLFEKAGREFVFVPGDTLTLGWEQFAIGPDEDNRADLESDLQDIDCPDTPEDFIREYMAPVRQVSVPPMLVARKLEEIGWEPVSMDDPRLAAHPDWMEEFRKFAATRGTGLNLVGCARFDKVGNHWQAYLYHEVKYTELKEHLQEQGLSLPNADEWAYLCGGGCRTLFPWGDGLDYAMHLYYFQFSDWPDNGPYDMEEPNFFGLSIAYDPYKYEVVESDKLTTCGGDGGCNTCGGCGPFLSFLPCSPHCLPKVHDEEILDGDYYFFRPMIRI